jgi:hypothetical protein
MAEGRSPFHGDSEHLHHVLRRSGLSSRRVALVILTGAVLFAGLGLGGYLTGVSDSVMVAVWLALGVIYHVIFGSGLVVRRRAAARSEGEDSVPSTATSGVYSTLWRQRR